MIELFTGSSLFLMSMENNKIIHRLKAGVTIIIEVWLIEALLDNLKLNCPQ